VRDEQATSSASARSLLGLFAGDAESVEEAEGLPIQRFLLVA
jgi:hypothetical protein